MSKQMTIRGVPDALAQQLLRLSQERKRSVNGTVLEILDHAVGPDARRERLARYATWTDEDFTQVQAALAAQRVIDVSLWN